MLLGKLRISEKGCESRVDDIEDVASVGFLDGLAALVLLDLHTIFLLDDGRHLHQPFRHTRLPGNNQPPLHPVDGFLESELRHVVDVVMMVVDGDHRPNLVVSLVEHALRVHVGESERSFDFGHSALLAPLLHRLYERTAHLLVVDEVYPSESDAFVFPCLVGLGVDDGHHAAHRLSVPVCHEHLGFAEFPCRILFRERVLQVEIEFRNGILAIGVEVVVEFHKLMDFPFGLANGFDSDF